MLSAASASGVILTLAHLGAGNSGSLWLEEEEKVGMCVCLCVYVHAKAWQQPSVGQVLFLPGFT